MSQLPAGKVPYYDRDGSMIDLLSEKKAHRYVDDGTATAKIRRGRLVAIIRRSRTTAFRGCADAITALHGASRSTRLTRADQTCARYEDGQVLGRVWEHKEVKTA